MIARRSRVRGKSASQNTDMSFPYTQAAGPQRYEAAVHLGFRYLEVPGIPAGEIAGVISRPGSHVTCVDTPS